MKESTQYLKPDAKGRVYLGELAKGVSSYRISRDDQNRLILEPYIEIPLRESWIFNQPSHLTVLKKGIQEASHSLIDLGSFQQHLKNDE